ncbi:hypothetical protein HZB02_05765 [Candidatus Woesearchaeota archaeon]|nr:hypothetical protein [Candidatus Woesearchaeota archaeon]
MNKKSQITLFIIAGIVMLLLIGVVIWLLKPVQIYQQTSTLAVETEPIKRYVEACFAQHLEEILPLIGLQGGYFGVPAYPIVYNFTDINLSILVPYYIYQQKITTPSNEQLQDQLNLALRLIAPDCKEIPEFPYDVQFEGDPLIQELSITNNSLSARVTMPVTINNHGSVYHMNSFYFVMGTQLGQLYKIAQKITESQHSLGNAICLSCIAEETNSTGIRVEITTVPTNDGFFVLYSLDEPKGLVFNFAHQFINQKSPREKAFEAIPTLEATLGYPFVYTVKAGPNLQFYDDTDLFDINRYNGTISFTPKSDDLGSHLVNVWSIDSQGKKDEQLFTVTVQGFGEAPTLEPTGIQLARVGKRFTYRINASSSSPQRLYYTDNTTIFDINLLTGWINFMPTKGDVGEHSINVTVTSERGITTDETMELIIAQ